MPTGNVKWFDIKKGYGFIIGGDGQDVFVHYTNIVGDGFRCLKDGEVVDYELVQSAKGFQARNVRRLAAPETPPHKPPAATPPPTPPGMKFPPGLNPPTGLAAPPPSDGGD